MANIPLQYPFPYKTINSTGFTSSVEFVNVTVLGDVTIDQNLTVSGNITTTDLTVGDDLTVGGQIDAQVLRAFGVWDTPIQTVNGAGAWIGFDGSGHTIFANRKSTAGQTNSWRWYAFDHTNTFQGELMRLSNAGNLFISGTRIEFPLIHFQQPPGTFPQYDFILPSSMGGAGQVLTSAGAGSPTYWTTPSGGGGGGGTVTNVTGTSPISVTSPTTTPNISLGTVPTTLGGTGLTTVGTSGQVLSSNGTTLQYVTLPTPVTSVSATSPLASSGGATPTISIASSTGSGAVVLANTASMTELTITGTPAANLYITSGTVGAGSLANTSTIYLNQVGGGGGFVNQGIQAAYNATNGYHISMNCNDDFVVNASDTCLLGTLNVGSTSPASGAKLQVNNGDVRIEQSASFGLNIGLAIKRLGDPTPANNSEWYTYIPTGSSDLRIYSANLGAAVITYQTTGNIGIGTTAPAQKLHVDGSTFITGSLGIGISTPSTRLYIDGGSATMYDSNNVGFQYRNDNRRYTIGIRGDTSNVFAITDDTAAAFRMVIDTSGNVGVGTTSPTAKLDVLTSSGTTAARLKGAPEALILDGTDHVFVRFAWNSINKAYIGYGNAANTNFDISSGNGNINIYPGSTSNVGIDLSSPTSKLHVNGTVRASNFTTNGLQAFTYASGTFTPRIAMFYTIDGKVYECNAAPAGRDNIAITYTVQTGVWVRMGNTMMINMEIQYNQTYSGIFFSMNDLNIVAVIPETACNPLTLGATGVTGYPSRIRDRFVDNFQMNYWISNTAYAPGGTICEVQLRRDNTHNMCPWDPTNKTGERVNITASYYVSQ